MRLASRSPFDALQIERFSAGMNSNDAAAARQAAIGGWAAMVGTVVLARLCDDPALSNEILEATRAWIGERKATADK